MLYFKTNYVYVIYILKKAIKYAIKQIFNKIFFEKTYFNDNILSFKLYKRYAIRVCVASERTYVLIDNEWIKK
jgi:hypothetical protein